MPKRILIFCSLYYPKFVGGAEVAVKEITDRLPAEEFTFDLLTIRADSSLRKNEKVGNVNVYRIGLAFRPGTFIYRFNLKVQKYLFPYFASRKAAKMHKKNNYAAIWSIMASFAGFAASLFKKRHKEVPFILTLQEGDPLEEIEGKVGFLFKQMFRNIFIRADMVQAISQFLGEWAKKNGFKGSVRIIPNAVDTLHFTKRFDPDELAVLEEKLGKKHGDYFIITTSRLVKKNAVDVVIRALVDLPDNVKFLILGEGKDEKMLRNLSQNQKVEDRVYFLGFVPHVDMPKYLKISDIFIRPSRSEGLGNSFLEAMAADLPVIATAVGGIPDFLRDKENGLYVKVDDPKDVANKVLELVQNPELRYKIIENGRRMVEREYNWPKIASEIEEGVFQV